MCRMKVFIIKIDSTTYDISHNENEYCFGKTTYIYIFISSKHPCNHPANEEKIENRIPSSICSTIRVQFRIPSYVYSSIWATSRFQHI